MKTFNQFLEETVVNGVKVHMLKDKIGMKKPHIKHRTGDGAESAIDAHMSKHGYKRQDKEIHGSHTKGISTSIELKYHHPEHGHASVFPQYFDGKSQIHFKGK